MKEGLEDEFIGGEETIWKAMAYSQCAKRRDSTGN